MTCSRSIPVGVAIAIGMAGGAIGCADGTRSGSDKDTTVTLSGDPCAVTAKEAEVNVGKGKKVTWKFTNDCDKPQVVVIGNFRESQPTSVTNCRAGIIEDIWPFKDTDESLKYAWINSKSTAEVVLKEAKNDRTTKRELYFDICVGGKVSDPKLIVDP